MSNNQPSKLTVIGRGAKARHVLCRCECGTIKEIRSCHVNSGASRSCGCLVREFLAEHNKPKHGGCVNGISAEYRAWQGMITRCTNKASSSYPRYGGRGIKVCERWLNSFADFLADVGKKPGRHYSIDRINNDGNYEPGNVRWTTSSVQSRNTSYTRKITHNGITLCLADWAKKVGINARTLYRRILMGWSTKQILETPLSRRSPACKRRKAEHQGEA